MHPDAALRAAVAAAPDAALPRLVYADFLDDHDHPLHAAALRLDVAMAAERPWADRYWLLKADRDAHTPADFPGDLGWLSDRQPLLVGVPDDWRSRWRAVRAFVSRWWGVPLGDVGRWGKEVANAERIARRELPPGVKEWAAFMAELVSHPVGEESLGEIDVMYRLVITNQVSLIGQGDGDVLYVIGNDSADPPVSVMEPGDEEFLDHGRYADSVAEFAMQFLLLYGGGKQFADNRPVRPDLARRALAAHLPHTGRFGGSEVFESPDALALLWLGGPGRYHSAPRVSGWCRPGSTPRGLLTRLRAAIR